MLHVCIGGQVCGGGSPVLKNDSNVFPPENVILNLYLVMCQAVDTGSISQRMLPWKQLSLQINEQRMVEIMCLQQVKKKTPKTVPWDDL